MPARIVAECDGSAHIPCTRYSLDVKFPRDQASPTWALFDFTYFLLSPPCCRTGFDTETHHVLVLEYVPRGELFDYVWEKQGLGEDEARKIFSEVVEGVRHCHENSIVHRDIKLENIMLSRAGHPKVRVTLVTVIHVWFQLAIGGVTSLLMCLFGMKDQVFIGIDESYVFITTTLLNSTSPLCSNFTANRLWVLQGISPRRTHLDLLWQSSLCLA